MIEIVISEIKEFCNKIFSNKEIKSLNIQDECFKNPNRAITLTELEKQYREYYSEDNEDLC